MDGGEGRDPRPPRSRGPLNDDSGQRNYSLANVTFPSAGTYYIGVQPYSSYSGTLPATYFLTVAPQ